MAAPAVKTPPTPVPKAPEVAKRKRGEKQQEVYPTAEACIAEAEKRTSGARRPMKVTHDGKTTFVCAHSEHHAAYVVACTIPGFTVEKLKGREKPKQLGLGTILEAINKLPEADRAAILAQVKQLQK